MNSGRITIAKAPLSPTALPSNSRLLQRACACGKSAGVDGECAACRQKRLTGRAPEDLQPKLRVGRTGDKYEREADHMAERVMRMPAPNLQRETMAEPPEEEEEEEELQAKPLLQREAMTDMPEGDGEEELQAKSLLQRARMESEMPSEEEPEEEDEVLQPKTISSGQGKAGEPGLEAVRELRQGGERLPETTRRDFEGRFGYDFGRVRLHRGPKAERATRAVNARAYTLGNNIVLGKGEYNPASKSGRTLLAHELTHVIQQEGESRRTTAPHQSAQISSHPNSNYGGVVVQREEFGEDLRFDSVPEPPPRAVLLGPYRDSAIAEELYGDPSIPIQYTADPTVIEVDLDRLLPQWRSAFREATGEDPEIERNSWPFPGLSADEIRSYIDERVTAVAVNLVSGRMILSLGERERPVEIPLRWVSAQDRDIAPFTNVEASREAALSDRGDLEALLSQRGLTAIYLYRDENGVILPTLINPQTAPRIMSVYPDALEAARADVRATQAAFEDLLFWYIGARAGSGLRASSGARGGRLIVARGRTLSSSELAIAGRLVREGRTVRALAESTRSGVRTADFVVDGVRTELKTITSLTSRDLSGALGRRILEGAGQAPHIIADVRGQAGMTRELASRAIRRAFGADTAHRIQQIRIIGSDFDLVVPRIP
jgi:hypothetical protein